MAKLFDVDHKTIQKDLARISPESGDKVATVPVPAAKTNSAKTQARRAGVVEAATAQGVTEAPIEQIKYRIIYADPPWDYGAHLQPDYQTEQRDHYPVMELDAICALPVKDWTEDNAVLFLWVTSPILEKAFAVIRGWGVQYKASFVWDSRGELQRLRPSRAAATAADRVRCLRHRASRHRSDHHPGRTGGGLQQLRH